MNIAIFVALIIAFIVIVLVKKKKQEDKEKVNVGLQVFDKNGKTVLDTTSTLYSVRNIGKILGRANTNMEDGFVLNDAIYGQEFNRLWIMPLTMKYPDKLRNYNGVTTIDFPEFYLEEGKLGWRYFYSESMAIRAGMEFIYGVY